MENIYLVDAVFQAKTLIRSLPYLHGARWSAWLRFACTLFGMPLNNILYGLLPLRNGQNPINPGEIVILRLIMGEYGVKYLPILARSIRAVKNSGEFSPESFELLFWKDAIGKDTFSPECSLDEKRLVPLEPDTVAEEIAVLVTMKCWTLAFYVPLRFKLPPGEGRRGKGLAQFCPPAFFSNGRSIPWLLGNIRYMEPCNDSMFPVLEALDSKLSWVDMRYNESRRIALGGVMGDMKCSGTLDKQAAQRCVLGQYLGVGKNPLFGLGYWRIPELDKVRTITLEEGRCP